MFKKLLLKYWLFLCSSCCFLAFLIYQHTLSKDSYRAAIADFQEKFVQKENGLQKFIAECKREVQQNGLNSLHKAVHSDEFYLHAYRNDSLLYWNSNQLPVLNFADIHFPSEGIIKMQNGWYYATVVRTGKVQLAASFLIQKEYIYENEFLRRVFAPEFALPFDAHIILDKENALPVYNQKHQFVFAVYPEGNQQLTDGEGNLLVLFFLLGVALLLFALFQISRKWKFWMQLALATGIISLQYLFISTDAYRFLKTTRFFDASLYANSQLFPNLFVFCLNALIIYFTVVLINRLVLALKKEAYAPYVKFVLFASSLFFAFGIAYLNVSLVIDSSIPLEMEKLFRLNYYSLWAALAIGILFYAYFQLIKSLFLALLKTNGSKRVVLLLWLSGGLIYFCYDYFLGSNLLFMASWPLIINGIILITTIRSKDSFGFNYGVILLLLFSFYLAVNINSFSTKKERAERELFANQLASDQDISTELEFQQIAGNLVSENYFQKMMASVQAGGQDKREISASEVSDFLERKYFNGFWDRYECDFYLFDASNVPLTNRDKQETANVAYLEKVLNRHSKLSEIDSNVFYIKDYTSQLSYIAKLNIYNADSSNSLKLYCTFKTKRIPEKIGFPRLLISDKAQVFAPIENYALAKYYNGNLVSQNGRFSYPIREEALTKKKVRVSGYFNNEGYNHFLFRKNSRDLIILSKKLPSSFQLLTSFSYLFCFFGFFLLLPLIVSNYKTFEPSKLTFALKIQFTFISIIVIALLAFGFGSGKFVSSQYNEYSNELIKEKIKAVQVEVKNELDQESELKIERQGDYLNYLMEQFAAVFVTDINLYDRNGYLLASSRPQIYNKGLLGEQINPQAFEQLNTYKKSEFIHQENIGNLFYLSAYMPLYNYDGKFLAYVNLQHFGQQQGFENQIERFLVAIINVFILLLAFSVILAIFVSNWVTSPLRILRQNLANIQLGKYNKPIDYQSNDEIGSLVKNYNRKLEELAYTAEQLAIRERESAWREMAKQVAHEIKNPLTPMKLSLQHLQRIYDPENPASQDKINQVVHSLIEQIDALTTIANEFSSFAKMPVENRVETDLIPIIERTVFVFGQQNEMEIQFQTQEQRAVVHADKELMLRVFNNLIQNAIQAIPNDRTGKIEVRLWREENRFLISVTDNGKGISEELQHKIFMPNFTTKSTGTGLGLAMVKQIVELHQGKITFETIENEGSTFCIEIPAWG